MDGLADADPPAVKLLWQHQQDGINPSALSWPFGDEVPLASVEWNTIITIAVPVAKLWRFSLKHRPANCNGGSGIVVQNSSATRYGQLFIVPVTPNALLQPQ